MASNFMFAVNISQNPFAPILLKFLFFFTETCSSDYMFHWTKRWKVLGGWKTVTGFEVPTLGKTKGTEYWTWELGRPGF